MEGLADTQPAASLRDLIDLGGRTAIVTGGAMGIGRGIAERLHEAGANVIVADLDMGRAQRVADGLEAHRPGTAAAVAADVSDDTAATGLVRAAVDRFGALDVLVNNAGIYPVVPLTEIEPSTLRHVLDVNLVGLFLCTQAAARQMIAQGRTGSIVNVTSIDALHPTLAGLAHYDASKHGAWGFTKNAALELAEHGIRVNAIAPGAIATPGLGFDPDAPVVPAGADAVESIASRIPMRRLGAPEEIGRVAVFLASDLSSYMTGAQIVVDGGMLLT
jgi:2-deoxy-D-gluconate 3-dehydrogenase